MKNSIAFTKMHALGNDFALLDCIRQPVRLTPHKIKRLAHRHKGVGFDQLLCAEPPTEPVADFFMRIYNADGSEAEQCGNGVRCFYDFVRAQGLTQRPRLQVQTSGGIVRLTSRSGSVACDMGNPDFGWDKILIEELARPAPGKQPQPFSIRLKDTQLAAYLVSFGNPHCVICVETVAEVLRMLQLYGKRISTYPAFARGANVGFMHLGDKANVLLRTYERGVGPTLACGSNICAAAAIAQRRWGAKRTLKVSCPGGVAQVQRTAQGSYYLDSPVNHIYQGELL